MASCCWKRLGYDEKNIEHIGKRNCNSKYRCNPLNGLDGYQRFKIRNGCCYSNRRANNFDVIYVNSWSEIGDKYGYTVQVVDEANSTLKTIFDYLKDGYPVIAKIHNGTNNKLEHWVVVVGYSGSSTTYAAKDFTCVDPYQYKSGTKALSSATNYSGIYKLVVYKK